MERTNVVVLWKLVLCACAFDVNVFLIVFPVLSCMKLLECCVRVNTCTFYKLDF